MALLVCAISGAETITGYVIRVSDGDTFTLLLENDSRERVRLYGIDAPESEQVFGHESRNFLARMINRKQVTVSYTQRDKYGRILGNISTDAISDVNLEMLKSGMAWHYSYFDNTPSYKESAAKARESKIGLWADPNPINPYEWRKKDINSLGNYKTSYLCTARFSIQQVKSKSIHPYVRR